MPLHFSSKRLILHPQSFTRLRVRLEVLVCSKRNDASHQQERVDTDAQAATLARGRGSFRSRCGGAAGR